MQASSQFDIVIVGGGFSGSALFSALKFSFPKLKILLCESAASLGGNHTWCFHDHDIPSSSRDWLLPLISKSWDSYEVKFPSYSRILESRYHSIRSADLHRKLTSKYQSEISLNTEVSSWSQQPTKMGYELRLKNSFSVFAHTVVDARGWVHSPPQGSVAYQKFVGLDVKLKKPHGLKHVVLKDVTRAQIDGYRFFYLLPWSEDQLLIEDTYYSNHSILKEERIEQEIVRYAEGRGWQIEQIERREVGCLPLTLYPATQLSPSPEAIGAASLYFHPVTGYTTPQTLKAIDQIINRSALTQESLGKVVFELRQEFSLQEKYYRLLNRMMFLSAYPEQRYKILERFYRLPQNLINRFYTGELTWQDQVRILIGKPPVSVIRALSVLRDRQPSVPNSMPPRLSN